MANWYDPKSTRPVGLAQQFMEQKIQMHHQQSGYAPTSAYAALAAGSNHRRSHHHLYRQQQASQPMGALSNSNRNVNNNMSSASLQKPTRLLQSSLFLNNTLSLLNTHTQASRLQNLATVAASTSRTLEMTRKEKHNNNNVFGVLVESPAEKDVLLGRGGRSNHHAGNERYRELIRSNRERYATLAKHEKIKWSRAIVAVVQDLGGRFLESDDDSSYYVVIPNKKAVEKTSQCLREKRGGRRESKAATAAARAAVKQSGTTSKAA